MRIHPRIRLNAVIVIPLWGVDLTDRHMEVVRVMGAVCKDVFVRLITPIGKIWIGAYGHIVLGIEIDEK